MFKTLNFYCETSFVNAVFVRARALTVFFAAVIFFMLTALPADSGVLSLTENDRSTVNVYLGASVLEVPLSYLKTAGDVGPGPGYQELSMIRLALQLDSSSGHSLDFVACPDLKLGECSNPLLIYIFAPTNSAEIMGLIRATPLSINSFGRFIRVQDKFLYIYRSTYKLNALIINHKDKNEVSTGSCLLDQQIDFRNADHDQILKILYADETLNCRISSTIPHTKLRASVVFSSSFFSIRHADTDAFFEKIYSNFLKNK